MEQLERIWKKIDIYTYHFNTCTPNLLYVFYDISNNTVTVKGSYFEKKLFFKSKTAIHWKICLKEGEKFIRGTGKM